VSLDRNQKYLAQNERADCAACGRALALRVMAPLESRPARLDAFSELFESAIATGRRAVLDALWLFQGHAVADARTMLHA